MQVEGLVKFREGDFKNTGTVFFQLREYIFQELDVLEGQLK